MVRTRVALAALEVAVVRAVAAEPEVVVAAQVAPASALWPISRQRHSSLPPCSSRMAVPAESARKDNPVRAAGRQATVAELETASLVRAEVRAAKEASEAEAEEAEGAPEVYLLASCGRGEPLPALTAFPSLTKQRGSAASLPARPAHWVPAVAVARAVATLE